MKLTKDCEKAIRNLARCRAVYGKTTNREEEQCLLENTMAEIQDLLAEIGIDWHDYEDLNELME